MRKTCIAAAIMGVASAAPSYAQSSVTISGRLNSTFERIEATGATLGRANDIRSRTRITENSSELRLTGREKLSQDLTAWFTIGSGLDVAFDTNFSRSLLGSRNTGLGLESKSWGTIMMGKWDVHYEAGYVPALGHIDFGYIDLGLATFSSIVLGSGQVGVGYAGGRLNNVVRYVTPQWEVGGGHLQIIGAYARNDEASYDDNGVAASNGSRKPRQIQFAPHYHNGPLSVFYSYYQDKESSVGAVSANPGALLGTTAGGLPGSLPVGLTTGLRDMRGDRFGVSWKFSSGLKVGLVYDRLKSEIYGGVLSGGGGGSFSSDLKRTTWVLPVSYETGPHKLNFVYGRAGKLKGTRSSSNPAVTPYSDSNTGATYYSLGYRYALSKRTSLYTDWAKIRNSGRAGYDFFVYAGAGTNNTNPANLPANSIGADPQTVQVGIYHLF